MLLDKDRKLLERLNKNIEKLMKNQQSGTLSVPFENVLDEWIYAAEAMKILQRSRSWLNGRLQKEVVAPMNVNWFLFKGVDWKYEGNKLILKRSSVNRLKEEMRSMDATNGVLQG